ncbi:MAG: haloacid dehalogenase [Planctomycetaceae bacterium]|nr:haloacid dehalogenase [Planctomycetaceae bacterium]
MQELKKPYEWIVFDAVGTLIYPQPSVAEAYAEIGHRYGSQYAVEQIGKRFRKAFYNSEATDCDSESGFVTSEEIEVRRWQLVVAEVLDDVSDPAACFADLFEHFGGASTWACFDDVASTLTWMNQRHQQIAIASNFDRRLNDVCDGLAPLASISTRVVSSEVGYRKPSQHFFDALIERLQTSPNNILLIGDDPVNDIQGGQAAGLDVLRIDRKAASSAYGVIRSLTELRFE